MSTENSTHPQAFGAVKQASDLIVMGTISRHREAGVFIGTTAEDVIQGSRIAVLALKPEVFVSPVTAN